MRLTEKDGTYKEYIFGKDLHTISGIKEWNNPLTQKLGQLEDIEEELGIDLITLFKALSQKVWIKYKDNGKEVIDQLQFVGFAKDEQNTDFNLLLGKYDGAYLSTIFDFKDYGKTWALTKEELE